MMTCKVPSCPWSPKDNYIRRWSVGLPWCIWLWQLYSTMICKATQLPLVSDNYIRWWPDGYPAASGLRQLYSMMTCKATQLALVSDNYIRRWRGCLSSPTTIFDDDPAAPILWQLYSTMTCKVTWIQWEQCKAAKNGNKKVKKHNKCLFHFLWNLLKRGFFANICVWRARSCNDLWF